MKLLIVFFMVIGVFGTQTNSQGCQDDDCVFSISNLKCMYRLVYMNRDQSLIGCLEQLTDSRMMFTKFKSFFNQTTPPIASDDAFEQLRKDMEYIIENVLTDPESKYLAESLKEFRICQEPSALSCKKSPKKSNNTLKLNRLLKL